MFESMPLLDNHILGALPAAVREGLRGNLELVSLDAGQVLYEPDRPIIWVYFPIDLVAALMYATRSGSSSEIAIVGNDGMLGVSVCLGGEFSPYHATVLSAGGAYRMKANALRAAFQRFAPLQSLLLRYVHALMAQTALVAACHRHHSVDHQLQRLLLVSFERLSGRRMRVTHEGMAHCLGVRREGVTQAAVRLQAAGIISYRRGEIVVLDQQRLESSCCECYALIKIEAGRPFAAAQADPETVSGIAVERVLQGPPQRYEPVEHALAA
jgi:CRP-like cAMP-binding protein